MGYCWPTINIGILLAYYYWHTGGLLVAYWWDTVGLPLAYCWSLSYTCAPKGVLVLYLSLGCTFRWMISGSADTPSSSAITSPMLRVKAVPGYSPNGLQMRGGSPPSSSSTPAKSFGGMGELRHMLRDSGYVWSMLHSGTLPRLVEVRLILTRSDSELQIFVFSICNKRTAILCSPVLQNPTG